MFVRHVKRGKMDNLSQSVTPLKRVLGPIVRTNSY